MKMCKCDICKIIGDKEGYRSLFVGSSVLEDQSSFLRVSTFFKADIAKYEDVCVSCINKIEVFLTNLEEDD